MRRQPLPHRLRHLTENKRLRRIGKAFQQIGKRHPAHLTRAPPRGAITRETSNTNAQPPTAKSASDRRRPSAFEFSRVFKCLRRPPLDVQRWMLDNECYHLPVLSAQHPLL